MAFTPTAFFSFGLKGPAADERKRQKALLDAKTAAEITALTPKPTVTAPVSTPQATSSNMLDATKAGERQRKRAAGGNYLVKPPGASPATANLSPRTLIGG